MLGRIRSVREKLDFTSLRTRSTTGAVALGLVVSLAWIAGSDAALSRSFSERETARAEAVTRSLAIAIDGDAVRTVGGEGLESVHRTVLEVAAANGLVEPLVVLATDPSRTPSDATGALRVVASSDPEADCEYTCTPAVASILSGERAFVVDDDGAGIAPVRDAFGTVVGLVRLRASESRTALARGLHIALASLIAAGVVFGFARGTSVVVGRHCRALDLVAAGQVDLACGRFASREIRGVAATVAAASAACDETGNEQTNESDLQSSRLTAYVPQPPAALPNGRQSASASSVMGTMGVAEARSEVRLTEEECLSFDPRLVIVEFVRGFETRAVKANIRLLVTVGDAVPPNLTGDPCAILEALGALIENALAHSAAGSIQVRASRLAETARVLFEVVDAGDGLPWPQQADLNERVDEAARAGIAGLDENATGLMRASVLAHRMGGKLEFTSQPGSGSRFWFTVLFEDAEFLEPAIAAFTSVSPSGNSLTSS